VADLPIYAVDGLTRRAAPLQATRDAADAAVRLAPGVAATLGVGDGDRLSVLQDGRGGEFAVRVDPRVAEGCAWLSAGVPGSEALGPAFGELSLARV